MKRRILGVFAVAALACGVVALRSPSQLASIFAAPKAEQPATANVQVKLPLEQKSVRFSVIVDNGKGDTPQ